jgi:hypothetical protein
METKLMFLHKPVNLEDFAVEFPADPLLQGSTEALCHAYHAAHHNALLALWNFETCYEAFGSATSAANFDQLNAAMSNLQAARTAETEALTNWRNTVKHVIETLN